MTSLQDSLNTLELDADVTLEDIKKQYRDLVQVWHPDKFTHNERLRRKAEDKLKDINAAYDYLVNYFNKSDSNNNYGNASENVNAKVRYCTKCGATIDENQNYCSKCGFSTSNNCNNDTYDNNVSDNAGYGSDDSSFSWLTLIGYSLIVIAVIIFIFNRKLLIIGFPLFLAGRHLLRSR